MTKNHPCDWYSASLVWDMICPVTGLRILVVDDHRAFADALSAGLRACPDVQDVRIAASLSEARRDAMADEIDVAIVDVRLGDGSGIDLVRELARIAPAIRPVVVTAFPDSVTGAAAVLAGAYGFMGKDVAFEQLVETVRGAGRGESWFPPALLTSILRVLRNHREIHERLSGLSPREYEVLLLMVGGYDRTDIARTLYLSVNTVRSHVKNILAKLDVHSSLEAVSLALQAGVRPPPAAARPGQPVGQR
jgi:DNA-binding NarL/FixJ family response regulator